MATNINIHSAIGVDLQSPDLGRFYKRNGHKGRIQPDDRCIWLTRDKEIIAAARLSTIPEHHFSAQRKTVLLRGLWVDKQQRSLGLGSYLLKEICTKQINLDVYLFCFAYEEIAPFYQKHGFKAAADSAPTYLRQKQKDYSSRGNATQLMFYSK
ncbi:GNAT family N-acetyltransferase [Neptuniibacter sp. QD72_48]|uniref:GNAT family N-acetyltransferase n=1 Tax=unclassified Neptuniibacter TaxID=2630693 RepID=UPI0039F65C4C